MHSTFVTSMDLSDETTTGEVEFRLNSGVKEKSKRASCDSLLLGKILTYRADASWTVGFDNFNAAEVKLPGVNEAAVTMKGAYVVASMPPWESVMTILNVSVFLTMLGF